ncbi:2Fe-2S iron-sulfur cluster binding domain-containing protein [Pseudooceanicola sp. GBMRC 2024]|uniref:2Fe-2S iron-sulfur cluster binding domain-containing protein n=1 Tax=Pseudooceanicola albus TaxID=2692189 RepID=A0A6L7G0G6_9RHOB|nr:PDR/VanB family oxidoreductase [Pseudooceanicola albus]MXN17824.1 2Fe-2S iron-sulfur cluster binding domain-containing protein [Pseudooceanicola albus]
MSRLLLKVAELAPLSPRVRRIRLVHPEGQALPVFSGGAHVTLEMPDGDRLRRNSYSLISDPQDGSAYEIAVQREDAGRGGSRFLHERLSVGDLLAVSLPANFFALDQRARHHVLIAGGIGLTPFLSQLRQLDRAGQSWELHYAVHRRAEALAELPEDPRIHLHVSEEGTRMDLAALLGDQPLGAHVYTCGPEGLIGAVAAAAAELGWPGAAVHAEAFAAPPEGTPFEVTIASSGQIVPVGAQQSLLEALEAAGIAIDSSCRGGACGRCETAVTACDGEIRHHDHWLSAEERAAGTRIMPCMSRFCGTRLELDL